MNGSLFSNEIKQLIYLANSVLAVANRRIKKKCLEICFCLDLSDFFFFFGVQGQGGSRGLFETFQCFGALSSVLKGGKRPPKPPTKKTARFTKGQVRPY